MGAYPALDIKPPAAPPNPLEQTKDVVALKSLLQAQDIQQQTEQKNKIEIQQSNQDLKDRQIMMDTLANAKSGDPDEIMTGLRKSGISFKGYTSAAQMLFVGLKDKAGYQKDQLDNMSKMHDAARGQLQSVVDSSSDEELPNKWAEATQQLAGAGNIDPKKFPMQFPKDRKTAQMAINGLALESQLSKEQSEKASQIVEDGAGNFINKVTGEKSVVPNAVQMKDDLADSLGLPHGGMYSPKFIVEATKAAGENRQFVPDSQGNYHLMSKQGEGADVGKGKTFGKVPQLTILSQQNPFSGVPSDLSALGITNAQGQPATGDTLIDAAAKQGKLTGVQATDIKALGNYDLPLETFRQYRTPQMFPTVTALLKQAYPNWNERDYKQIMDTQIWATGKGEGAQQGQTFNTAVHHLGMLDAARQALGDGNLPMLRKIGQFYKIEIKGDDAENAFDSIQNAITGELGKLFKGGVASDPELANIGSTLRRTKGDAALKGAINSDLGLMQGRLDALYTRYKNGMTDSAGTDHSATRPDPFLDATVQKQFQLLKQNTGNAATGNSNNTTKKTTKGFAWPSTAVPIGAQQ